MTLVKLQGQRSVLENMAEGRRGMRWTERGQKERLTIFARLRLEFVSNDPEKNTEMALKSPIVVVKFNHAHKYTHKPTQTHTLVVPVDGADAGHAHVITHSLQQQPVSYLPGEHGGVGVFQMQYRLHHSGYSHFRFRASNHPWSDTPCLIVPK